MIEVCDECEYTILIADLIATLMTYDKDNKSFQIKIWYNTELPFEFDSYCYFVFLQEGIRVEYDSSITYVFYDLINCIEVFI